MNPKKRGLGRQLDELFLSKPISPSVSSTMDVIEAEKPAAPLRAEGELCRLPVNVLQRGRYQPRREISEESVAELADSIRAQGIIQPIVARSVGSDRYEIIAGERRWRAAQLAGLTDVPVIIRSIPDEKAMLMSLIENIQRQELNPIEEAQALQRLMDEFALTHEQVAQAVGKSRTSVTNALRLLSLSSSVRDMLEHGDIEMGHARALLTLDAFKQLDIAKLIVEKNLSVRETERLVKDLQTPKTEKAKVEAVKKLDPDVMKLQSRLSDTLAAKVAIDHEVASGKGKLVIYYNTLDELDGILEHIS